MRDTARRPPARTPAAPRTPAPPRARGAVTLPARRPPARRAALGDPARRLHTGLVLLLGVLLVLGGRLVWLQGGGGTTEDWVTQAVQERTVPRTLFAQRGAVLDRDGSPLAGSVDGRYVYGEPHTLRAAVCTPTSARPCTPATVAAALAPVLGRPAADLEVQLARTDTKFVYLGRELDPSTGEAVRALALPGVGVRPEPRRVHPGGDLAASVVGFTDRERNGAAGIELAYDQLLRGVDGKTEAEVDVKGRVIPQGEQSRLEPVPGTSVQLTLDRDLQWEAQKVLAAKVAETGAESGSVVVMDVQSGEVLALATAPTFDPDDVGASPPEHRGNPALSEVYEPGSVNKIITMATALEAGTVTPDTVLSVPDRIQVAGSTISDSHSHPVEQLTMAGVLVTSSNVGTVQIAQRLGPQGLYDGLREFGFGDASGLGLPGESRGILAEPADWSGTSLATISFGQGVSANAVQVASVYQTIANGGVRMTPRIVAGTVDPNGVSTPAPVEPGRRVVSDQVAAQVRTMLEGVVSDEGTAPLAAVPGYRIAGKTGTAQRVVDGRYQPGNYSSSFIGYAPADAPRLVTAVVLQGTGSKGYYGGAVAGPVFKDVMAFALRGLQVPPTGTQFVMPALRAG